MKRIVPEYYTPEDVPEIIKDTEIAPYGPLLQGVPANSEAANEAQGRMLAKLREHGREIQQKYQRSAAPRLDQHWIHDANLTLDS